MSLSTKGIQMTVEQINSIISLQRSERKLINALAKSKLSGHDQQIKYLCEQLKNTHNMIIFLQNQ